MRFHDLKNIAESLINQPDSKTSVIKRLDFRGCNVYLIEDSGKKFIVDTGTPGNLKRAKRILREIDGIIITHAHYDHAGSAFEISEDFSCEVYAHPEDIPYLTGEKEFEFTGFFGRMIKRLESLRPMKKVEAKNIYSLNLRDFRVIQVPGHTPGSITLVKNGEALVGDLLRVKKERMFAGKYIPKPSSRNFNWDQREYVRSLEILKEILPLRIYPGHGISITINRELERIVERLKNDLGKFQG